MRVRIISGSQGGRFIQTPPGSTTHPMSERVRSAMFNSLGAELLQDAVVLDAFAGSGSLGLEALSRGASNAIFVERDRGAQKVLEENIQTLQFVHSASVIKATVSNWINTANSPAFDLIFVDPPYDNLQLSTVVKLLELLKPGGIMVLSHPGIGEVPLQGNIVVVDNRSYGTAHLTYFRRER